MAEKRIFMTKRIEDFIIPAYKKDKCSECRAVVGISKESYEKVFGKYKNIKIVCFECFQKIEDDDPTIVRPSLEEIKAIRKVNPDFGEAEIRENTERFKDIVMKKK